MAKCMRLLDRPADVFLSSIVQSLNVQDKQRLSQVCKSLNRLLPDPLPGRWGALRLDLKQANFLPARPKQSRT